MASSKYMLFFCTVASCLCIWIIFDLCLSYPHAWQDLLINQRILSVQSARQRSGESVRVGNIRMSRSSVTIVGVAKNLGSKLKVTLEQVDELSQKFNFSRAIFVEGDSTDNTLETFKSWAKKSDWNRTVLSIQGIHEVEHIGSFQGTHLPREGRIAMARNVILKELRKYPKTDYVISIDMDILGWDPSGIADSFGRTSYWDVVCAHGVLLQGSYRDVYAFRDVGINTNHHMCGDDHLLYNISANQKKINRTNYITAKRTAQQIMDLYNIPHIYEKSTQKPIEVESCFGGMAIYKYDALNDCEYNHRHPEPPFLLDCEHVIFNQCMRDKNHARITTNPNMKLWYGHTSLEDVDLKKELRRLIYSWR